MYEAAQLTAEEWARVEQGNELQILDLTNIMRARLNLKPLLPNEEVANVAYLHSKDMFDEKYFAHESPTYGNLADRLDVADIYYKKAGENIAAQYFDGAAAVAGWLNSKGHRETMLDNSFSHLGVGVYRKYYTQNFIEEWVK